MTEPKRSTKTVQTTSVRYVAGTFGRNRENPPSLGHLREFVAACEGLPDDLRVRLEQGHLDEGGRHTYNVQRGAARGRRRGERVTTPAIERAGAVILAESSFKHLGEFQRASLVLGQDAALTAALDEDEMVEAIRSVTCVGHAEGTRCYEYPFADVRLVHPECAVRAFFDVILGSDR